MKKILIYLFLITAMILPGDLNINAKSLTDPNAISFVCVNKELSDRMVFVVNQDMDFNKEEYSIYVTVEGENGNNIVSYNTKDNFINFQFVRGTLETCGGAGEKSVSPKTTLLNVAKKGQELMIVFENKEVLKNAKKIILEFNYIGENQEKYNEMIVYDVENMKVESTNLYNLTFNDKMIKAIGEKYNNHIFMVMGDPSGFTFGYDASKQLTENTVEIGSISFEDYTKSLNEILNEINILIEKSGVVLSEDASINEVNSGFLKEIKDLGEIYTYEKKNNGSVSYSWTFDGSKITNTDLTIDLNLNVGNSTNQDKIESLVKTKEKSLILEFSHHGVLPEGTKVKVNVKEKFINGTSLTLYYYNEDGKLEEVSKNLEVKDGFVELGLEHCSEYVLVETSNNAQTGT